MTSAQKIDHEGVPELIQHLTYRSSDQVLLITTFDGRHHLLPVEAVCEVDMCADELTPMQELQCRAGVERWLIAKIYTGLTPS